MEKIPKEVLERVEKLRSLIDDYRYHYHVLDESLMSEEVADSLKHELVLIEEKYPELVTPDSPTQKVAGKALNSFNQVRHSTRMISLKDVFNRDEVAKWVERTIKLSAINKVECLVDIKMDGLACSLVYMDGVLERAATRGDGFVGEDVTNNVRTIKNVPLKLRKTVGYENFSVGRTEIRGEIIMMNDDFAELNKQRLLNGESEFANPRNLAAGTIRQLDPKLVEGRPLSFRAYDVIRDNKDEIPTNKYAYGAITALGINRNKEAEVVTGVDQIMSYVERWSDLRNNLPFNTDGVVIKLNDRAIYDSLGIVGKQPRGAVAFKYLPEKATSVLRDIVISIGRTGAATPVAVFDPTIIAGSLVKHASLHNSDEITRRDIRIGDTIVVYKAGDIIPKVESVIFELRPDNSMPFDFEAELSRQYPELEFERPEGEAVYRIKGASGELILKKSIEHFASKSALDIDTLGEKNVVAIVDNGLVSDVADIYSLKAGQLMKLERFAEISANKLIDAIGNSKNPPLERFLYALGIRHVGLQTALDLVKKFKSMDVIKEASYEDLLSIDGVGKVVAESIVAWFSDEENQNLLNKFSELGVNPVYSEVSGKFDGINFVVTGTLRTMSRDEVAAKIRALGGNFQSSTAKDTNYLIVGEKVGSSKIEKAKKYGTEIINEQQFIEMLG